MKNRLSLVGIAVVLFVSSSGSLSALEERSCAVKITVSGNVMPETEVVGAGFKAWGRDSWASETWDRINSVTKPCALKLYTADYSSIPAECAAYEPQRRDSTVHWQGVIDLESTRVRSLIKKVLCARHPRPAGSDRVRTIFDTRNISGLYVFVGPVGNSRACTRQTVIGPKHFDLHCRRKGKDTVGEWFYSP